MTQQQKKTVLRLFMIAGYIAIMVFVYTREAEPVDWFWLWPLFIVVLVYNLFLWAKRCPACKEEFALVPGESGVLLTVHNCRYCGAQCQRINGGHTGGGGGP